MRPRQAALGHHLHQISQTAAAPRSGPRNLRAWCQRCHLAHDRPWHLLQRWISYRLRYARGDLSSAPTGMARQPPSCSAKS